MVSRALDYMKMLRPQQWVKNLLVMAAPAFGGVFFSDMHMVLSMLAAFFAFSFAASAGYILNDLYDAPRDRLHPTKRYRPVASGRVGMTQAVVLMAVMLALSVALSLCFPRGFIIVLGAYLLLDIIYTAYLQHIVLIDAFSIAVGFVLRISAGGLASAVEISSWLYLTTLLLALLLAFGKRRYELAFHHDSVSFRRVLAEYKEAFLDKAIVLFSTASIVTYAIYAVERGPKVFIVTMPLVCFGVLRYFYLVERGTLGDPTEALIKDKTLLGCVLLWIVVTGLIIYRAYLFRLFS